MKSSLKKYQPKLGNCEKQHKEVKESDKKTKKIKYKEYGNQQKKRE